MNKTVGVVACALVTALVGCSECGCGAKCQPQKYRAKVTAEPGRVLVATDFAKGMGGWSFGNFKDLLTTQIVNAAGCASFKLTNCHTEKTARDTAFNLTSDFFAVEPGSEFAVVVEARGSMTMESSTQRSGLATAILWFKADRQPMLIQDALGKLVPTGYEFGFKSLGENWIKTVKCSRVPAGAAFAKVRIGGDAPDVPLGGGYLELKRVTVRAREGAAGDWDFGDLEPPTFERLSASPDPNPLASIRFAVRDASRLDLAKFVCKLDGVDITGQLEREGEEVFVYRPTVPWAKDSLHLLALEATDECGNFGAETLAFFCGERLTKGVVTLRDDDMVLVDGRPFFPIAPFSLRKGPPNGQDFAKAIADLKAAGFNAVHSYCMFSDAGKERRRDYVELFEVCEAAGMKLLVEAADRNYRSPERPKRLLAALQAARNYTCLLGWGLGDDTASHRSGAEVRADHNLVKAIDNARLTWQADITTYEGRQLPYVGATDVLMTEIYPFRAEVPEPEGLANVARYMKFAYGDKRNAGNRPWSIWALPQAFSGWGLWKRFPTTAEIRAQSYISIVNGAKGLTYYTYYSYSKGANGFAHKPEQFASMAAVAKELSSIQDDLASRDAKVQPPVEITGGPAKDLCGNASVTCLMKEGAEGKGALLIAVNTRSDQQVTAKIAVAGAATTLFEHDRKVEVKDGFLVDEFAPGAVHVYRLR